MKHLFCLAVLALCACGSPFTGEVSGYPLNVHESLFVVQTDSQGAATGAAVILSDQSGTCALLAAAKAPPNATMAVFAFGRKVDNKALSPDTGEYTVGASGASVSTAYGVFLHTDANGTSSIPSNNSGASSGLLKIDAYSSTSVSGSFDGKFGQQNDAVTTAFTASVCTLSSDTLNRGFLGTGVGPDTGGGIHVTGGSQGSCTYTTTDTSIWSCVEYVGSTYAGSDLRGTCTKTGSNATWSSGGCPSGYGTCAYAAGTSSEYRITSGSSAGDPASTCSSGGGSFSYN